MCRQAHRKNYLFNFSPMSEYLSRLLSDTLIVLVVYQRKLDECPAYRLFAKLDPSLSGLFIYDNSAVAQPHVLRHDQYIHSPGNDGVSKAYNCGSRFAAAQNKQWLLLLDQDTTVTLLYLEKLAVTRALYPSHNVFVPKLRDRKGYVSPLRWRRGAGVRLSTFPPALTLDKFRFLNSGLLIAKNTFDKAGMYAENIPLYFSDIEFGHRLQAISDEFVVVDETLVHDMSSTSSLPRASALHRYHAFCTGAFAFGRGQKQRTLYTLRAFFRGAKLSWQYRHLGFMKTFCSFFV